MLLITFDSYILDSYFKFILFYTVFVGVKIHTYHTSSVSIFHYIFSVYNRYYYKGKKGLQSKKIHLKKASTVLIGILNLLLGKLCCYIVKRNKLKVRWQMNDNCKLLYSKYLHYFTLPNFIVC